MSVWTDFGGPTWIYNTGYDAVRGILYTGLYGWAGGLGFDEHDGGVWAYDGTTWTDITLGTTLDGDIVWTLLYVPERDLLYAGVSSGGVWSYDGSTWTDLGGAITDYEVWSLAYDPVHDRLYAGTGNWSPDNGIAEGVWKYDGATWTLVSSVMGGANLLSAANCSFETSTGTWQAAFSTCTIANSTDWASVGTHSLKITPIAGKKPWVVDNVTAVTAAATPYTVTCKFRGIAGRYYNITAYDDVTGLQGGTAILSDGTEQRLAFTGQFGAASTYRQVGVVAWENHAVGEYVYMDDVQIVAGIDVATLSVTYLAFDPNHNILYAGPETYYSGMAGVWACANPDTTPVWTQFPDADVDHHHLWVITYDTVDDVLYAGAYQNVGVNAAIGILHYDGSSWVNLGLTDESIWYLVYDATYRRLYVETSSAEIWICRDGAWESVVGPPSIRNQSLDVMANGGIIVSTWEEGVWFTANPAWTAPIPLVPPPYPVTTYKQRNAYIIVQNMAGTSTLAELSEQMPDQQPAVNLFEDLTFESCNPGGFTTASFVLHRPVNQYWPDILHRNRIIIGEGATVFWEGFIDRPTRKIRPDTIDVACQGWSARLNELWATADITVDVTTDHLSEFLINVVLADAGLSSEIVAGTIETGDYDYPDGTVWKFAPATFYSDCISQLNAGNGYDWGVWLDHKLDFKAKAPTVVKWLVKTSDCEDLAIAPNPDALCNYVLVDYTQDGTLHLQVMVTDATSPYSPIKKKIAVPGKITTAGATQIANLYLASCKDLHVAGEFTCSRIFDIDGAEHHLGEVRGGENLTLVPWLPTEETLTGVNDIATFQIKTAKYDHAGPTLDITPTEFLPATDIQIARLQATGY